MSSPALKTPEGPVLISTGKYLRRERTSETKHEYSNGEVRPMAGASCTHNLICANLVGVVS